MYMRKFNVNTENIHEANKWLDGIAKVGEASSKMIWIIKGRRKYYIENNTTLCIDEEGFLLVTID